MIRKIQIGLGLLAFALLLSCVPVFSLRWTGWVVDCYLGALQRPVADDTVDILSLGRHGRIWKSEYGPMRIEDEDLRALFQSVPTAQSGHPVRVQLNANLIDGSDDLTLGDALLAISRIRHAASVTGRDVTIHFWLIDWGNPQGPRTPPTGSRAAVEVPLVPGTSRRGLAPR